MKLNQPSASALAALLRRLRERKPALKALAVLADPVFGPGDARLKDKGARRAPQANPGAEARDLERATVRAGVRKRGEIYRLPFSRLEAETIFSTAPAGQAMKAVDFAANKAAAMNESLSQYRIVHFATHGLLDDTYPELSGIVLSLVDERGRPETGFLRLHEIYQLKMPAELVVLSACQTGLGKDIRGEGLVGLARGFMHAGAARVVASLWKVDDAATAELMGRFYKRMLGQNAAGGLCAQGGAGRDVEAKESQLALFLGRVRASGGVEIA